MKVENLSKNRKQLLSRLGSKKMREKSGLFIVEGHKSVFDIFDLNREEYIPEFIVTIADNVDLIRTKIVNMPLMRNVSVYTASPSEMREISSLSTPPDILAVFRLPRKLNEDEILSSPLSPQLYLMLDGVQDPGNLGTIIRTAHWFGINRIFASRNTVDLYNSKVVKSTMGSLGRVEVDYIDLIKLIERNPQIPVVGLILDGDNLFGTPLPSSAFIVMGNEGNGVSAELRNLINLGLTIPPYNSDNHSESLNVAVATAITLAAFRN